VNIASVASPGLLHPRCVAKSLICLQQTTTFCALRGAQESLDDARSGYSHRLLGLVEEALQAAGATRQDVADCLSDGLGLVDLL